MHVEPEFIKQRAIGLIRNTSKITGHILKGVSQEDATTYRDGPDGWTVAEILGHMLDYSVIFYERANAIVTEDNPTFTHYDQDQLVRDRRHNEKNVEAMFTDLAANFERLAAFYESIRDDQWDRAGLHPEQGYFTLTRSMIQVGTHSTMHIEQMTRVLTQKQTK